MNAELIFGVYVPASSLQTNHHRARHSRDWGVTAQLHPRGTDSEPISGCWAGSKACWKWLQHSHPNCQVKQTAAGVPEQVTFFMTTTKCTISRVEWIYVAVNRKYNVGFASLPTLHTVRTAVRYKLLAPEKMPRQVFGGNYNLTWNATSLCFQV